MTPKNEDNPRNEDNPNMKTISQNKRKQQK